jgi:excisionase family DNA binding protein
MEKALYRPSEAAEVLGLSRSKVYELISRGNLPSVHVGHSVRVRAEDLAEWIRSLAAGDLTVSSGGRKDDKRRER